MGVTREWDGASYDRISGPMADMGLDVLARLELQGNETVIDAGCGSGRITAALLDRLSRGHVIAVDGSADMIAAARQRLGDRANLEYVVADLAHLDLGGRTCDAVLSTATFHWIPDHPALVAALHRALRPGGRLVAQCGGMGNIDGVHRAAAAVAGEAPYAQYLAHWEGPWNFRAPDAMAHDLKAAGFTDIWCRLTPRPVTPDDPVEWFSTIVLGAHVQQLPERLRRPFAQEVATRMPQPVVVDYVRLDIDATRA